MRTFVENSSSQILAVEILVVYLHVGALAHSCLVQMLGGLILGFPTEARQEHASVGEENVG